MGAWLISLRFVSLVFQNAWRAHQRRRETRVQAERYRRAAEAMDLSRRLQVNDLKAYAAGHGSATDGAHQEEDGLWSGLDLDPALLAKVSELARLVPDSRAIGKLPSATPMENTWATRFLNKNVTKARAPRLSTASRAFRRGSCSAVAETKRVSLCEAEIALQELKRREGIPEQVSSGSELAQPQAADASHPWCKRGSGCAWSQPKDKQRANTHRERNPANPNTARAITEVLKENDPPITTAILAVLEKRQMAMFGRAHMSHEAQYASVASNSKDRPWVSFTYGQSRTSDRLLANRTARRASTSSSGFAKLNCSASLDPSATIGRKSSTWSRPTASPGLAGEEEANRLRNGMRNTINSSVMGQHMSAMQHFSNTSPSLAAKDNGKLGAQRSLRASEQLLPLQLSVTRIVGTL